MSLLEILEHHDPTGEEIVYRFPPQGSADIKLGAQLVVHQTQEAVLYRDGKALDVFGPGRHTLSTQNIPLLGRMFPAPEPDPAPLQPGGAHPLELAGLRTVPFGVPAGGYGCNRGEVQRGFLLIPPGQDRQQRPNSAESRQVVRRLEEQDGEAVSPFLPHRSVHPQLLDISLHGLPEGVGIVPIDEDLQLFPVRAPTVHEAFGGFLQAMGQLLGDVTDKVR